MRQVVVLFASGVDTNSTGDTSPKDMWGRRGCYEARLALVLPPQEKGDS